MVVFLAGVVGINYDTHYCCGEKILSEISIIPETLSCGMGMDNSSNDSNQGETIEAVCCENDHLSFEIDDDYLKHNKHVPFIPQMDVIPMDMELVIAQLCNQPNYEDLGYSPPPLDRDIIVLVQSFLI